MESVSVFVYCNGIMIPSYEGIVFECHDDSKVITISGDMLLDALRKTIFDTNRGSRILLDLFYHQPIYVGDGCVEYNCMKLKHDDDVETIFFIYSKFSTKCLIELNATFGCSLDEILALLRKPRKSRIVDEIIVLIHDESL